MAPLLPSDPAFDAFVSRIPLAVAATLTDTQLEGLQQAYFNRHSQNHAVNLKVSLPLPGQRFYLVLLAGPERRATRRSNANHKASLGTQVNVAILTAALSLVLIVFGQVLGGFLADSSIAAPSSSESRETLLP